MQRTCFVKRQQVVGERAHRWQSDTQAPGLPVEKLLVSAPHSCRCRVGGLALAESCLPGIRLGQRGAASHAWRSGGRDSAHSALRRGRSIGRQVAAARWTCLDLPRACFRAGSSNLNPTLSRSVARPVSREGAKSAKISSCRVASGPTHRERTLARLLRACPIASSVLVRKAWRRERGAGTTGRFGPLKG